MSAAPWREFEKEIAALFERVGFHVQLNAAVARPRQTDLFAHDDKLKLLIEIKRRSRKIDVGDIDALRTRLARTSSNVVGVLASTSELTRGAKEAIEGNRTQEIVVFVGRELEWLRAGQKNVRALIEQKRNALIINGKVWIGSDHRAEHLNVKLPDCDTKFVIGKASGSYFESRSGLSGGSYALEIPDTGWTITSGEGARLSIQLDLNGIEELQDLFGYLHKTFGLSKNGTFSIHQTESGWHGAGAQTFIDAAKNWRIRYRRSPAKAFHHSEELAYFDKLHSGWIRLSLQQRVGLERAGAFFHHAELIIQLPGIPLDTSRFLRLCQYVNNDWAHFENVGERRTSRTRLRKARRLNVVGKIIDCHGRGGPSKQEDRFVSGIVVRNPFYQKSALPMELRDPNDGAFSQLLEDELMVCSLRGWHGEQDRVDFYELEGIERTEVGSGYVLRPFGTWNQMLK